MRTGDDPPLEVFTIGYGRLEWEAFVDLLRIHGIETLADVRSQPYSKYSPAFQRKNLERAARPAGLRYVFLGEELGGRPPEADLYVDGRLDFAKVADSLRFQLGLGRLLSEAREARTALMCAEENPRRCHRRLLITPELTRKGVLVRHIRANGNLEKEENIKDRQFDLFGYLDGI